MSSRNANRRHRSYNQGGRDRHNNTFSHGAPAGQAADPSVPPTAPGNVHPQMSRRHHSFHQGDGQNDSFGQGVPTGHGSVPSRQTFPPNARGHVNSQMSRRNRSYHQGERAVPNGNWSHEAPAGQADPPRPTVPPTVPGNVHQQGFHNAGYHPNAVPVQFNVPIPPGLGQSQQRIPQAMPPTGMMWPQQMMMIPPGHYPTSTTVPMYMQPPTFRMPQDQNVMSAQPNLMNQSLPLFYPMNRTFSELDQSYQPDMSAQAEFGEELEEVEAPSGYYSQQPLPHDTNTTFQSDALITRTIPDTLSILPGPGRVVIGYLPVYSEVHTEDGRPSRAETRSAAHHRFSVSRARNIEPFVSQVQNVSNREEPQEANQSRVGNQERGSGDVRRSRSSVDRRSTHPKAAKQPNVGVKTDTTAGAKVKAGEGSKPRIPTGQSPTSEKIAASGTSSSSYAAALERSFKDVQINGNPPGHHISTPQSSNANPPTKSSASNPAILVPKSKSGNIPEVTVVKTQITGGAKSKSGEVQVQRSATDPSFTSETVAEGGTSREANLQDFTSNSNMLTSSSAPHTLTGQEKEFQPVPKSKSIDISKLSKKAVESMREAVHQARLDAQSSSPSVKVLASADEASAIISEEPTTSQLDNSHDVSVVEDGEGKLQSKTRKHKHKAQKELKKAADKEDDELFQNAQIFNMNTRLDKYVRLRGENANKQLLGDLNYPKDSHLHAYERLLLSCSKAAEEAYNEDLTGSIDTKNELCHCIIDNAKTTGLKKTDEEQLILFYKCMLDRDDQILVQDCLVTVSLGATGEARLSNSYAEFWTFVEVLSAWCK